MFGRQSRERSDQPHDPKKKKIDGLTTRFNRRVEQAEEVTAKFNKYADKAYATQLGWWRIREATNALNHLSDMIGEDSNALRISKIADVERRFATITHTVPHFWS